MSTSTASNKKQASSNKNVLWWIVGGVVGLTLIIGLAWSIAGETDVDESVAFGEVTVEGEDLPFFQAGAQDPAVGITAPTVIGEDLEGSPLTIGPDERAKIIVMLAHWCPHC
jgi:hypothetical protein